MRGLSMWISCGKYAGWVFELEFSYPAIFRIVCGWVSFVIITVDILHIAILYLAVVGF